MNSDLTICPKDLRVWQGACWREWELSLRKMSEAVFSPRLMVATSRSGSPRSSRTGASLLVLRGPMRQLSSVRPRAGANGLKPLHR